MPKPTNTPFENKSEYAPKATENWPVNDHSNRDTLYAREKGGTQAFVFDADVAEVFPDMINRSVPGYTTIIHMIGQLAQRYARTGSRCYDLGCSLGAASLTMAKNIQSKDVEIVAVDSSRAMLKKFRSSLNRQDLLCPIKILEEDILNTGIREASVVVLNFTLQFVAVEKRAALLKKIYQGMLPGGILILSEKLAFADSRHENLVTDMHHYFKQSQGYSELEIAQKRNALENVLLPETFSEHETRLRNCGFDNTNQWFQCFNFASMFALK